jgi:nucleobase:cation symporter-1, NCS1 family
VPFLATDLYTGPLVAALGGADISWILGLVVPGVLYYAVVRNAPRHIPSRLILPGEVSPR